MLGAEQLTLQDVIDLSDLVSRAGGAIATHELKAAGVSRTRIRHALARGEIRRARQGWYLRADASVEAVRAVRVGGLLTCSAALRAHGLWSVADSAIHVRVAHGSCRLRRPGNRRQRLADHPSDPAMTHWRVRSTSTSRVVASAVDALEDWFQCAEEDWALGALDSLLRREPTRVDELLAHFGVSEWTGIDGRCESGTEALFFHRMLGLGIHPWRQVPLAGAGRFDFQIGTRMLVEIDGATFHDEEDQFTRDRRKDAVAHREGFLPMRFSHDQVLFEWGAVRDAVVSAIARGDHHR